MLNTVILMGRLTDKPELRKTNTGISVTAFTLAIDKPGKNKETNWIECCAWRETAEFICNFFDKGQMIAITGSLQTRTYTTKAGQRGKATEVLAEHASFCGSKADKPAAQSFDVGSDDFEEVGTDDDLPFNS